MTRPTAVVMNMYYTGLGIARSLGENGVPVIGLTSQHRVCGNFTRYAKIVFCPDSRNEPEALLEFLLKLGRERSQPAIIFPTRDDDVVFLDRYREALAPFYRLVIPPAEALAQCIDKWQTHQAAQRANVPSPNCWLVAGEADLERALPTIAYPCVLKPVEAHHWRKGANWNLVGGRKAIGIASVEELRSEYAATARANPVALIQEMIPGDDDCLIIAACYMDRNSQMVAAFNTQKLVQEPVGFGTGCIVQSVDRPEVFPATERLLRHLGYTGIAEVEYKWDSRANEYKLIEINPRPWDQHRLGRASGTDLVYLAYCEQAGMDLPKVSKTVAIQKWIAEDTFLAAALRLAWHRDPKFWVLFRAARGKRTYAMWSVKDPVPFLAYFLLLVIPKLVRVGAQAMWSRLVSTKPRAVAREKGARHDKRLEDEKLHG